MADIVWNDVTGFAAELSTVSALAQTLILAYVNSTPDPDKFGGEASSRYKLARILLAAHYGTVSLRQGQPPAGPVIAEGEGNLSRAYGFVQDMQASGADLFSTGYGKEYRSLVRRSGAARAPLVT